ncbi:6-pyruvoyl trahydropterin synthase family protein [Roseimaritima ulvae]|uniref:6-carboxy-5,6,7,8-tetrahydropterin synthase n=1 Tax=Roseimaritima ulvae TaxID=980254 RepID=A0A5B9QUN7_9BACT|nr:6-carboxytetrahydropterin synthase [Roseimaritima ulvae]QEG41125.1 6-carboxy-5,6,7,8-tetrahydropterin synthase [Roseimaritima ulvae]
MSLTVMRRVTFCAGHRLLNHDGKCVNLHGHNYVAEFYVVADQQDEVGRVIDFKLLKIRCKGWLDEHWDHAFLLWDKDTEALNAIRQTNPHRIFELPYNPTAENLAKYLLEIACPQMLEGTGARAQRVVIWESEESCAEVTVAD